MGKVITVPNLLGVGFLEERRKNAAVTATSIFDGDNANNAPASAAKAILVRVDVVTESAPAFILGSSDVEEETGLPLVEDDVFAVPIIDAGARHFYGRAATTDPEYTVHQLA